MRSRDNEAQALDYWRVIFLAFLGASISTYTLVHQERAQAERYAALDKGMKDIASAARVSSTASVTEIVNGVTEQLSKLLPKPPHFAVLRQDPIVRENDGSYMKALKDVVSDSPPNNMPVAVTGAGVTGFRIDPMRGGAVMMTRGKQGDVIFAKLQTPPGGKWLLFVTGSKPNMRPQIQIFF